MSDTQQYKNALLWVTTFLSVILLSYQVADWSLMATVNTGRTWFRFQSPMAEIGELQSENLLTFNWWLTSSFYLLQLVPLSAFIALAVSNVSNPQKQFKGTVTAHMVIGAIMTLGLFAMLILLSVHLGLSNNPPDKNLAGTNLANDPRYCCVEAYAMVDENCPNYVPMGAPISCANPLTPSELRIPGAFWIRFFALVAILGFIIASTAVAWYLRKSIDTKAEDTEALLSPDDVEAQLIIPATAYRKARTRRRHH